MGLFLGILVWGLAAVIGAVILVLIAPLHLRLVLASQPRLRYQLTLRPLGAMVPAITLADSRRPRKPKVDRKTAKKPKRPGRRWLSANKSQIATLPQTLSRVLAAIQIEELSLNAEFGTGDPAETGALYGQMTPLIYGATGLPAMAVALRPNFDTACLNGTCSAQIRLTLLGILAPLGGFLWRVFRPWQ